MKQSIFSEIQSAYGSDSLKFIKAAATCWLSHGTIAQQVLDCFEPLVASLDAMYLWKYEPAVRGLHDSLNQPNISTLCFLTDVLKGTNVLQMILQGSQLNFVEIPTEVQKLIDTLRLKAENPMQSVGCYFSKISDFLEIASKSSESGYKNRSSMNNKFDTNVSQTVRLFVEALIDETEIAFDIPEQMKGFASIDPMMIPQKSKSLKEFGINGINALALFYSQAKIIPGELVPQVVCADALHIQYEAYKLFILKDRPNYECKQQSELTSMQQKLDRKIKSKEALETVTSKRKLICFNKSIKSYEQQVQQLSKQQKYSFNIMLKFWYSSNLCMYHGDMTKILTPAALIQPSMAEMEWSFSSMKLICIMMFIN